MYAIVTTVPTKHLKFLIPSLTLATLLLLACDLSTVTNLLPSNASQPVISIQSPPSGSEFREGDELLIQTQSTDKSGISRVDLLVDGVVVKSDAPPIAGQDAFTLIQKWVAIPGAHILVVRAYNDKGVASEPASIAVNVTAAAPPPVSTQIAQATRVLPTPTTLLNPTTAAQRTAIPPTRTATRPLPTNTPNFPPGVYGISVRLDPPEPRRATPPTFYVTFLNTTGESKSFRWFVKIYEPDKPNSKGETSKKQEDIPVGRSELASPADWTVGGIFTCQQYVARVFYFNADTKETFEFTKPDNSGGPNAGFQFCP
ncbi:MAG: hypothetical protein HY327_07810 [Chloroflexi bacterium]|nr:hypothetical protein [Chloroflexota bacterium]